MPRHRASCPRPHASTRRCWGITRPFMFSTARRVVNDQHGSPTYADLVAEASVQMLDGMFTNGVIRAERCGLYHLTCQGETTWWSFAKRIIDLAGFGVRVRVTAITTADYPTPG